MSNQNFPEDTPDSVPKTDGQESPAGGNIPAEGITGTTPHGDIHAGQGAAAPDSAGEDNVSRSSNGEGSPGKPEPDRDLPLDSTLEGIAEIVRPEDEARDEEPSQTEEVVDDLAHIIESIVFASDEPLPLSQIKSVLDAAHTFGRVNPDVITGRIEALNKKYDADGTGFRIMEIANGYQYATRKEMALWVSILFKEKAKRKLSNSALETLAIIAYKQPVTKPEIEAIRGVNVDYVLHSLLEKEIVTVVGRAETVGRPLLYGTTHKFLKIFALRNLEDLPRLREIEEIIREIRSKGAEESIQLEITALTETPATDAGTAAEPDSEPSPGSAPVQE